MNLTEYKREYMRKWRAKNPDKLVAMRLRERGPDGRVLNPQKQHGVRNSYSGVHGRLRRERGPANQHVCPCGKQAHDWAFDEPTGFSDDLDRYTALCRSCHRFPK